MSATNAIEGSVDHNSRTQGLVKSPLQALMVAQQMASSLNSDTVFIARDEILVI